MPILLALKAIIASKAVAVGAGTALVAGGLAAGAQDVFLFESVAADGIVIEGSDGTPEEPLVEEPLVEEPLVEEPLVEEPLVEEPVVEEPVVEEPVIEEPVIEERVVEEPAVEGSDGQGEANRSETANRVHEVIAERDTFESGRDFGKAVSRAARGLDDGEAEKVDDGDAPKENEKDENLPTEDGTDGGEVTTQSSDGDSSAAKGKGNGKSNAGGRKG